MFRNCKSHMSILERIQPSWTIPSPPIWGCLVMIIDCRAGEGVDNIPVSTGANS